MTDCGVSCISCGLCAKNCPKQAITMEDGVNGSIPVIDYDKCVGCGLCVQKCPRKCLVKITPLEAPQPSAKRPDPWAVLPARRQKTSTKKPSSKLGAISKRMDL